MKWKSTTLLKIGLAWQLFVTSVAAQCAEDLVTECAARNRYCRILEEEGEACYDCLEGYVGFYTNKTLREDFDCISIESIGFETLEDFLDDFGVTYKKSKDTFVITDEDKFHQLVAVAYDIKAHNDEFPPPDFNLILNEFALDTDETKEQRAGFVYHDSAEDGQVLAAADIEVDLADAPLPSQIDWVELGAVTSVKHQGHCGGCWAFAACGAIEGAAAIHAMKEGYTYLQSLSPQQFISCNDKAPYTNSGCDGGSLVRAGLYSLQNSFGGLTSLNDYPFSDFAGQTTNRCKYDDTEVPVSVQVTSGQIVLDYDDDLSFEERLRKLKRAVTDRPVAVVMKSVCDRLYHYHRGVLNGDGGCACPDPRNCIDHAVLLVGFNDEAAVPFLKIKNSWGTGWGENGYFRVSQQQANGDYGLFGILSHAVMAEDAFNLTAQEFDKDEEIPTTEKFEWWHWALIGGGGVLVLALLGVLICSLSSRRRKHRKKHRHHKKDHQHDAHANEGHTGNDEALPHGSTEGATNT